MLEYLESKPGLRWVFGRGRWAWAILALMTLPAIWHVVDFPDEPDPEFPGLARPTFSPLPPPAYRLAEPGDTIDRIGLYLAAGAVALATVGRISGGGGLRISAIALGLAAAWYAAAPGPTFDGWHGWGWRTILDAQAPIGLRIGLGAAAVLLAGFIVVPALVVRPRWGELRSRGRDRGALGLFVVAGVLVALRQVEVPGVGPVGYWPRWAFAWGMLAFDLALMLAMPPIPRGRVRWAAGLGGMGMMVTLIVLGLGSIWYHRPLERLKTIVPGRIYISAMPTYRGLEVAQARHHFKTIINLFPEVPPLKSPLHEEEIRFVRERGIHYVESPGGVAGADAFLDRTLALAQDPGAWPILLHCHGCMDRTPAWVGIYRFVVQGAPLAAILREIEQHRGYRPKASVTLLFNRVLPSRAPEHYADDPTAPLLVDCAAGTCDPYFEQIAYEAARANRAEAPRVSRREGQGPSGSVRRP